MYAYVYICLYVRNSYMHAFKFMYVYACGVATVS